jgi:hypothetical protein
MDFYYHMIGEDSYCIVSYTGKHEHVEIPVNFHATVLFDKLFRGHSEIKSVKIPDSITNIGGFVFDGCTNMKEIILPEGLTDMWQYAFTRCGIESIAIPGNVRSILPFTFYQCENLKQVRIGEGTANIFAWAFKDCPALRDVYLPKSLTYIDDQAFAGCEETILHYA